MNELIDTLLDELCQEIERSKSHRVWSDHQFKTWADRIARAQAECNPSIHRPPRHGWSELEEISPITTDSFRFARVATFEEGTPLAAHFLTSGTSSVRRGQHFLYRTDVYDCSARVAFENLILEPFKPSWLLSLVPTRADEPNSSLSYMVDLLSRTHFADRTRYLVDREGLSHQGIDSALREIHRTGLPCLLFTTTLAADSLMKSNLECSLPSGSLILTTGGAKGRLQQVDLKQVDRELSKRLGNPIIGAEYGMTELLSQAYRIRMEPFRVPPWCRVLAIDPETGCRMPHGNSGLLRFIDLANIQSALSVQTADVGTTSSDNTFTLQGRAARSELRGCSLAFEELERSFEGDS